MCSGKGNKMAEEYKKRRLVPPTSGERPKATWRVVRKRSLTPREAFPALELLSLANQIFLYFFTPFLPHTHYEVDYQRKPPFPLFECTAANCMDRRRTNGCKNSPIICLMTLVVESADCPSESYSVTLYNKVP